MAQIECLLESRAVLGEGNLWDPQAQVLWWVDIKSRLIHRFDPQTGDDRTWTAPEDLGCLAVRGRGGLVVTMSSGFYFFDPVDATFTPIVDPEAKLPENRFNDGKPDRQGRFWAGTMHDRNANPSGALYRLDPDLSCHRMVEGITCSNGLAWSPDSRTMYYADSPRRTVWAWDFDPGSGDIDRRRVFIDTHETGGVPDGATVDQDGCYWLTLPRAWLVVRYDPTGREMTRIRLPVDLPTCVAFGGAEMDVLYVTTATFLHTDAELAEQPLSGGLFALDVGVRGIAEVPFVG